MKSLEIDAIMISTTSAVVGTLEFSENVKSKNSKFMYMLNSSGLGGMVLLLPNNVQLIDDSVPKN